jgi:N-acyl-D-amino-acid deacylase
MLKLPGIATLFCVFLTTATPAQQPSQDKPIPEIDSVVQSILSDPNIPGASIAIAHNGKLLYARGYGKANQDTPVLPTHLFRIASISKPITAIAIMQLVEANKLKLSDKVTDILTFQPVLEGDAKPDQRWKEITIEQLLQHRAGFNRDKSFDPMFRSTDIARATKTTAPANPDAIIRYMMGRQLDFDPGTAYSYSNFGYCLLGRVIEKKSGLTYENYVHKYLLEPLGIHGMRIGYSLEKDRSFNEVEYHPPKPQKYPSVFPPHELVRPSYGNWYLEAMDSHGGWIASAVDLARIASSLDEASSVSVLNRQFIQRMFQRPDSSSEAVYYGLGWQVRDVGSGKINTWHTGLLPGTSTILVRRHDGYSWAVLFNGTTDQGKGKPPQPSSVIDPKMHHAIDSVKNWPNTDLFPTYLKNSKSKETP